MMANTPLMRAEKAARKALEERHGILLADEELFIAKAVLEAIREPSEHAMDCGAYRLPGIDTELKQVKARDVYRAMIDAALSE